MTKSENRNSSADGSFWYNDAESMVREEPAKPRAYDLEECTARFGEAVIDFVKQIPQDAVTNRLISQLIGAATSVGANYVEADANARCLLGDSSFVIPSCFVIRISPF